jgi:hypothetical protein
MARLLRHRLVQRPRRGHDVDLHDAAGTRGDQTLPMWHDLWTAAYQAIDD